MIPCGKCVFLERCSGWGSHIIKWTSACLTNRIVWVQLNGVYGTFKEGLLQRCVLFSLVFVICINDLLGGFDEKTMVSAYANGLAIVCRGGNKMTVAARLQVDVDHVVQWPEASRLQLNAAKCKTTLFTLDEADTNWQLTITIDGRPLTKTHRSKWSTISARWIPSYSLMARHLRVPRTERTSIRLIESATGFTTRLSAALRGC